MDSGGEKSTSNPTFSFCLDTLLWLPLAGLSVALMLSSPDSSLRNCIASRASTPPSSLMSYKQTSKK